MPFFSCFAQVQISDTTNFQLVYKENSAQEFDLEIYHFNDKYFVRESTGTANAQVNGEEVIQIGDVEGNSLFNYYSESKRLLDNFISPSGRVIYQVISQNDTVIDGNNILHLKLYSNRGKTLADITTTDVFYLKSVKLPEAYRSIEELYGWKIISTMV